MLARIDNDAIAEQRDITLGEIPAHKRDLWKPIEGDQPTVNRSTHTITGPTYQIEPTRVLRVWQVTPRDLATVKGELHRAIDTSAETVRLKYISPGAGQAMTYQEKNAQAQAVFGLGEVAANALTDVEREAQFPTLAASVGIEAPTLWDCATLVIARYEAWATLSLVIERTRLGAKKAITEAADVDAAQAAFEAVQWTV